MVPPLVMPRLTKSQRSRLRSSSVVSTLLKLRLRRHLPRGFILVAVQNTVLAELEIRPDLSVDLSVLFFASPFFEQVDGRTVHFSEKGRSKTGTCTGFCRGSDLFSVLAPPIEFGRWHSPQVAPAAPPAPRVHSSIKENGL